MEELIGDPEGNPLSPRNRKRVEAEHRAEIFWKAAQYDEAIADRDRRQEAIDTALSALHSAAYVGGPTEREAWQAALQALEPFQTHRQCEAAP